VRLEATFRRIAILVTQGPTSSPILDSSEDLTVVDFVRTSCRRRRRRRYPTRVRTGRANTSPPSLQECFPDGTRKQLPVDSKAVDDSLEKVACIHVQG
jgi:hypothetical protein